ncbi:hypothetical protein AAMO2058_001429300 [Amorphochlora amoebiformis]
MSALHRYLSNLRRFISSCDGKMAKLLLSMSNVPAEIKKGVIASSIKRDPVIRACRQYFSEPWMSIIAYHVSSVANYHMGNGRDAFELANEAARRTYNLMRDKTPPHSHNVAPNWYLPIVNCVITQVRLAAYEADRASKGNKNQRAAFNLIRDFLTACNKKEKNQSPQRSLKMGMLFVVNHLFKICFRINLLRNTSNLRASIQGAAPPLENFPKSQTVTYKFYVGRLLMMEEKYAEAEEALDFAFKHCHIAAKRNKMRVLQFLIPVKLLLKKTPHPRLLQKYPFPQFQAVIQAVRKGDLKAYNRELERHEDFFVQTGVFLVMEKLKKFVYRNLVKKVLNYVKTDDSQPNKSRVYLTTLKAALKLNGVKMEEGDYDEIECILANLIYEGLVKGYIAHGRCLVVSKKMPFPK